MHGAVLLIFFDDCSTVVYGVKHITINGEGIEMLTPKQFFKDYQFTIASTISFAQVKAGNTSENLLTEICQIIYSLYWEKEITKKVYQNIMDSIQT